MLAAVVGLVVVAGAVGSRWGGATPSSLAQRWNGGLAREHRGEANVGSHMNLGALGPVSGHGATVACEGLRLHLWLNGGVGGTCVREHRGEA